MCFRGRFADEISRTARSNAHATVSQNCTLSGNDQVHKIALLASRHEAFAGSKNHARKLWVAARKVFQATVHVAQAIGRSRGCNARWRGRVAEPRVLERLSDAQPGTRILAKETLEKVERRGRARHLVIARLLVHDGICKILLVIKVEWPFAGQKRIQSHTARPCINRCSVRLADEDLRCRVPRRSAHFLELFACARRGGQPKVDNCHAPEVSALAQNEIFQLQVAMNATSAVHV
mmetsp:Transcript_403/g.851  ORF Transcript_403/g.851 Transcript_403/m.851 type:complete len:235 (-) Transcript_403:11-715(-)